jgi:hypothetical protein
LYHIPLGYDKKFGKEKEKEKEKEWQLKEWVVVDEASLFLSRVNSLRSFPVPMSSGRGAS